jgi:hypothetical protein
MIHVQTLFVLQGFSSSPLHSVDVVWSSVLVLAAPGGCASFSDPADGAEFTGGGVGVFEGSCAAIGALKSASVPPASNVHASLIVECQYLRRNRSCHRRAAFVWIVAVNSMTSLMSVFTRVFAKNGELTAEKLS